MQASKIRIEIDFFRATEYERITTLVIVPADDLTDTSLPDETKIDELDELQGGHSRVNSKLNDCTVHKKKCYKLKNNKMKRQINVKISS